MNILGILKEVEICNFDKTWSACQRDDGSCESISKVVMVKFSYNKTKCQHGRQNNFALWSDLYGTLMPHDI